MKKTVAEINEIIAKGMGLETMYYCTDDTEPDECAYDLDPANKYYQDCSQKDPLACNKRVVYPWPDFFTWDGFGEMMAWWDKQPGSCFLTWKDFDKYVLSVKSKFWPEHMARVLASHFAGKPIELDEVEAKG